MNSQSKEQDVTDGYQFERTVKMKTQPQEQQSEIDELPPFDWSTFCDNPSSALREKIEAYGQQCRKAALLEAAELCVSQGGWPAQEIAPVLRAKAGEE